MKEYKLSHVKRFDSISVRLKDKDVLREVARGYLYNDSDAKGVYVYAFLSTNAIDDLYEELQETLSSAVLLTEGMQEEITLKHTCPYFFQWSEVAYLQLG
jgi:hypothetical protein